MILERIIYFSFFKFVTNFATASFNFKSIKISPDATMFWTFIIGLTLILIFILAKFFIILFIDSLTFFIDLAPVQTTLPDEKIKADVLGSFILITKPGNCSGLYSVFGKVSASFINGISWPREAEQTMLTILISFFAIISLPNLYL